MLDEVPDIDEKALRAVTRIDRAILKLGESRLALELAPHAVVSWCME